MTAEYRAVQVAIGDDRWLLANDQIGVVLVWSAEHGLTRYALIDYNYGQIWPPADEPLFRVSWNGHDYDSRSLARPTARTSEEGGRTRLDLSAPLAPGLQATLHLELAPGQGVFRQWLAFTSDLAGDLGPPQYDLALAGEEFTLSRVRGVQQQGGWTPASEVYESFQLVEAPLDRVELVSGERSTWWEMPWLLMRSGVAGVFIGIEAMGQWHARAVAHGERALLTVGATGYTQRLEPGSTVQGEAVFVGLAAGDLYDAARVQRRYMRATLPPIPAGFPWVQYNTWYSLHCDVGVQTLERELAQAVAIGCELFYIDAGWWQHSALQGDHFSSGLGLWREHPTKYPHGIRAFADAVRAAGLHFGIWVEPERVDLRTAASASWHESWLASGDDGVHRVPWPADTDTGWLCFAQPDAQQWAIDWITELIERLGVRWLKWDSNWWGVCANAEHGHGAHGGEPAQLAGVRHVWATLRARFPDLVIENCAGGGTRLDFASMMGSHAAWLSDATEPGQRVRQHLGGVGVLYPPERCTVWVVDSVAENMTLAPPIAAIETIFRSRMLGALGISARLDAWPPEALAAARDQIAVFKQIRPHLVHGDVYTLLPHPLLHGPQLRTPRAYEAYQIADGDTSVLLVFRNLATEAQIVVRLRALDLAAHYRVDYDGQAAEHSGADLCHNGLTLAIPLLASALVWVRRV